MDIPIVSSGSISDIVIALSTVVYTIGTFLLWVTTKRNTELLSREIQELRAQRERERSFNRVLIDNSVIDAHRELWYAILNNAKLLNLLISPSSPTKEDVPAAELLGSILINHCARVHLAFQEEIYDVGQIDAFARDARSMFNYPLVKWRWNQVSKYHTRPFIDFVEKMIES